MAPPSHPVVPRDGGRAIPAASEPGVSRQGHAEASHDGIGARERGSAPEVAALGDRPAVMLFRDRPRDPDGPVRAAVRKAIADEWQTVTHCYGTHAASEPDVPRVRIRFRVLAGGHLADAALVDEVRYRPRVGTSSEGYLVEGETALGRCLLELVRGLRLVLPPDTSTPVDVELPFRPIFSR